MQSILFCLFVLIVVRLGWSVRGWGVCMCTCVCVFEGWEGLKLIGCANLPGVCWEYNQFDAQVPFSLSHCSQVASNVCIHK